jgi:hypothetical protein
MKVNKSQDIVPNSSGLTYAVTLFLAAKNKSDVEVSFHEFFNGESKWDKVESAMYDAVILTYYRKMGRGKPQCRMIFNIEKEYLNKVIKLHSERHDIQRLFYYRMFIRILSQVSRPTISGARKKNSTWGFKLLEKHYLARDQIMAAIEEKAGRSTEEIISQSRKNNLPFCRVVYAHIFLKLFPEASCQATAAMLGNRKHCAINHYFKLHQACINPFINGDKKAAEYRDIYAYVYEKIFEPVNKKQSA